MTDLEAHRPELLRHCYRMLGSFADAEDVVQDVLVNAWKARDSFSGNVPIGHWLMRIATNACLNELARRRRRALPQDERAAGTMADALDELEAAHWLTPAPDAQLFAPPAQVLEARESVALAFLALLQRVPPRQRAVLLLKDVVGWSAEDIAAALELSLSAVNSALHRARQVVAVERPAVAEPPADLVRAYVRSWEAHDLEALVALLHDDVVLAMPPFATWFRGRATVATFLRSEQLARFWAQRLRIEPTRANGQLALVFYANDRRHSVQLPRFEAAGVVEMLQFIGAEQLRGFDDAP